MYAIILTLHILLALVLIGLVLIQHGKGAEIGAAFGSGASNTVFGSQGSGGFLFKLTGILAACFFATSLLLGYLVNAQYQAAQPIVLPQTAPSNTSKTVPLPEENAPAGNNTVSSDADGALTIPPPEVPENH